MAKNEFALTQLEKAVDTYIREYEERRRLFASIPKIDSEPIFALWDEYLAFLDANKAQEEAARKEFELKHGKLPPDLIISSGGFDRRIHNMFGNSFKKAIKHAEGLTTEGYSTLDSIGDLIRESLNDNSLFAFFIHDIGHITMDLYRQFWDLGAANFPSHINRMRNEREKVKHFLDLFAKDPEFLYGAYVEPYKMLQFIAASELGNKIKTENFSPSRLAWQTGYILRNRNPQAEYDLNSKFTDPKRNEIVVDVEDFTLNGNSGVVFSIIYNLAKNSYKKFGDVPNMSQKIFIQIYETPFNSYVITVGDSGKPIDLNKMKEQLRRQISTRGIDSLVFPNDSLKRKFGNWQDSEYRVGELTMKDMTDIAFMARMSGFDNANDFSSGLGLYGLKYFVQRMGGRAMYGEDFDTGSPIFTFILPKNLSNSMAQKLISSFGTGINATLYYYQGNQRKVA